MTKSITFILIATFAHSIAFGQIFADNRKMPTMVSDTTKNVHILSEDLDRTVNEDGTIKQRKADKLYKQMGYQASADLYERMVKKGNIDNTSMAKLAKSHRLNGDTEGAEYWYSKIINANSEPSTMFYYAQALQSNGKCEDAVRWYNAFNAKANKNDQVNIDFIDDCSELNQFESHEAVLTNASFLNSESLDFSAVPFKKGVVFTSTRGLGSIAKNTDNWTKDNFSDLFYAERNEDGSYSEPVSLANDVNGRFHDGAASFTTAQNVMYFSRNNRSGNRKKGNISMKIYTAEVNDEGVWSEGEELPFNSDDFITCHPTLNVDGQKLYFASNRPGGFGGMDIYVSEKQGNTWSAPMNLGPEVNTVGNEIFPVINQEDILFFASNGHRGLGGLDIFAIKKMDANDEQSWTIRKNIGTPFNSKKDDFGFVTNANTTEGFVTSSRDGGKGEDDIYEWTSDEPIDFFGEPVLKLEGKTGMNKLFAVIDMKSKDAINDAIVTFETTNEDNEPVFYTSDNLGELKHLVRPGKSIKIKVEKDGYESYTEHIESYDLLTYDKDRYELELVRRACTEMNGVIMNKDCDKPLADATIRVFNKCTGEEETFTTNRNGTFESCLKCGCEYEIIGNKDSFTEDRVVLSTLDSNCDEAKKMNVLLDVNSISPANFVGIPKANELAVGSVITLENIYYDFNKYKIRPDASTDLDDLVRLMNENPSLEIELGSHTDARGTDTYNQKLSLNRASAAVTYLVKKGIDPDRIIAKGYGESQLTNGCGNGVNCDEDEHQRNRRTEIKVTRFDNPNVRIINK